MLVDAIKTKLVAEVASLAGERTQFAAELSELIRQKALPNSPAAAFLVPAGLRPKGDGESAAGAFTQAIDEVVAIVLVINSASDVTGGRALDRVDELVWAVIMAIAGWMPPDLEATPYTGDFRLLRGQIVSLTAGAIIYQLEFAIALQLRKFS